LDLTSSSARGILGTFASSCAYVGAQNIQVGGGPLIIVCPEHAAILARDGFSKADVKQFLYDTARVPLDEFPPETLNGMIRVRRPKLFSSENPTLTIPLADRPEDIQIIVAGGPGTHSCFLPSLGVGEATSIKPIA
jgi:hypothetical protein